MTATNRLPPDILTSLVELHRLQVPGRRLTLVYLVVWRSELD